MLKNKNENERERKGRLKMDLFKDLKEIGAYLKTEDLREEEKIHFLLTSDLHSNEFFNIKNLFSDPSKTEPYAEELIKRVKIKNQSEISRVVGIACGGALLAYEIARQLNIKCAFIKDQDRGLLAGEIAQGEKIIVVEDEIMISGGLQKVIAVLEGSQYQAEILAVCAIIDRSGGKAQFWQTKGESLKRIPIVSISTRKFIAFKKEQCPYCKRKIPLVKY